MSSKLVSVFPHSSRVHILVNEFCPYAEGRMSDVRFQNINTTDT
jgi:hypothetical protein